MKTSGQVGEVRGHTKAKSYWSGVCCDSERDKRAVASWFSPICDGWEPIKAEILCDIATDREKKLRALFRGTDGRERWAIRSKNRGGFSITLKAEGSTP